MFTGLIKDVGTIIKRSELAEGVLLEIETSLVTDIKKDDSIAVNGCCLTAIEVTENSFLAQAVHVTLQKTALGQLKTNSKVNLELALRLSDRLGGHLVQGHVNAKARLIEKNEIGENVNLWFEIPMEQMKYIIPEGSIAIDGISLTVANIVDNALMVTIIPHTWNYTHLKYLMIDSYVNIEVDMMAKYLENFSKYDNKEKMWK